MTRSTIIPYTLIFAIGLAAAGLIEYVSAPPGALPGHQAEHMGLSRYAGRN